MNRFYRIYNLTLASDLPFPELLPQPEGPAAVRITEGEVLVSLNHGESLRSGEFYGGLISWAFDGDQLLLHFPDGIRFLMTKAGLIRFEREAGVPDSLVRMYLLGSCLAFLLQWRGYFALHGSAARSGTGCVAFIGDSGAGKSTLMAGLLRKGFGLLTDDVCVIHFPENGRPEVFPAYPQLKLWEDAARNLAVETATLEQVVPELEKYRLPAGDHFVAEPLPLQAIFYLSAEDIPDIRLFPLSGMDKIQALLGNTYRGNGLEIFEMEGAHFQFCSRLAAQLPVWKLERPKKGKPELLVERVANLLGTGSQG